MLTPEAARVLALEDDPGLARLLEKQLKRHGYRVTLACTGQEGLDLYEAAAYDIVVTDHVMPEYTGLQVIRELKARGPLPPIIMITGTGSEQVAVEALKLGASDYIVKDVDGGYLELLPSVIEQALRQHRLLAEKQHADEERERLLQGEREQRLRAETLAEVTMALASLTNLDAVLDEILQQAQRIVPHSAASIALLEDDTLRIARARGYGVIGAALHDSAPGLRNMTLYRAVIAARQPLIFSEAAQPGRHAAFEGLSQLKACIVVPIRVQDRDLGLLRLDHDMAGSFSAHDIDRLRPFASAAAIALENARLFREVQRLATIDDLTGIYNRRALFEQAAREVQRAMRFAHPLSITMFDLDHFKQVNDTHGHAAGDQALRMVAQRCRESIRAVDILGRFGGEEFVVVLPETNTAGACLAAERVRRRIVDTPIVTDHGAIRVTCSLGVTSLGPNDDFDTLLKRADQALYDAKAAGRNCVRARDPQVKSGPCGFDTKP